MARINLESDVLGVFAKRPDPGRVKTRLAAATSPEWAARVAEAFLRDGLDRLAAIGVRRVLAHAPVDANAYFADVVQGRFALRPQVEGDLGRRMAAFFSGQFDDGAVKVVLVGTDSPTLPLAIVHQAFGELDRADVVLGPAGDGGYYLVGCQRALPPIFDGIAWGTAAVLGETIARLANSPARLALLPPWYDVDTLEDWHMLRGHLAALRRAGTDPGLPRIESLLREA